jgi:hypothetical protein
LYFTTCPVLVDGRQLIDFQFISVASIFANLYNKRKKKMRKWKLNKGKLVPEPSDSLVIKRQFRWTFQFENIHDHAVKSLKFPIRTINKNGFPSWGEMVVEYYDICSKGYDGLWDYILPGKFEASYGTLNYYNGTGDVIHSLELFLNPTKIEVSDPDYSNIAESTVKIYFDVLKITQRDINEGKIPKPKSRRRSKPKTANL